MFKDEGAVIAGTAHAAARSFTAKELQRYEDTKAYREQGICWVVATRGWYPALVVDSWDMIRWPMNQFRSCRLTIVGMEVAAAYNTLFRICTDKRMATKKLGDQRYAEMLNNARFILTTEEDNVIPPEAVTKMLAAIYKCPDCGREVGAHCSEKKAKCKNCREWRCEKGHKGYDAIGGLYSVKTDPPVPMAFGNPKDPSDFKPRSVKSYLPKVDQNGNELAPGRVMEVNAIAMGCSLFRKGILAKMSKPWFNTGTSHTQDIYWCQKARKEAGARFGVHCDVLVGHMDTSTYKDVI